MASAYDGPNTVRVIECPYVEYRGYPGAIAHLNFLIPQTTGDIILDCSADDYNDLRRVKRTVETFEVYNPSYLGTRVQYETPEGTPIFKTDFPERNSRFVGAAEAIKFQIGSSSSMAMARDLWEKIAPLGPLEAGDVMLPVIALFERGLYFLDETLHHHVNYADLENTGVEGQMLAARDEQETLQLGEVNGFHNTHHWVSVYKRLLKTGHYSKLTQESFAALFEKIVGSANNWSEVREQLTLKRIPPIAMRT